MYLRSEVNNSHRLGRSARDTHTLGPLDRRGVYVCASQPHSRQAERLSASSLGETVL